MKNTSKRFGLYVAWLVAASMLVYAAIEKHPYSFYSLLRWICCPVFAYSAFSARERNRISWSWIFGVLAALYNPFFPAHLDRSTWVYVNWSSVSAIVTAAVIFWCDHEFLKKETGSSEANQRWLSGYNAVERGKQHYSEGQMRDALECFDRAIECGFEDGDVYNLRGSCLQTLNFNLDAIHDFDHAIALKPEDSNFYYMRALSKSSTGDFNGSVSDLREAIRLSIFDNARNRNYDAAAKEMGHKGVTALYKFKLIEVEMDAKSCHPTKLEWIRQRNLQRREPARR